MQITIPMNLFSILLLIQIVGCFLPMAFADRAINPNLAIRQVADEINLQLSQDDTPVGLIPLTSNEDSLDVVCDILTRMLAARLVVDAKDRFIGLSGIDWRNFATDNGLLSISQAKKYGKSLPCKQLITGRISRTQPYQSVHGTLFLWDTTTGYLNYFVEFKSVFSLSSSPSSTSTAQTNNSSFYLKWKGLPQRNMKILALDVADTDGDGYNELILAEANRVKILEWNGAGFEKRSASPDIQYRDDESPITDRERRTLLSTNQAAHDRDELYIGSPPDTTWRVAWTGDDMAVVSEHSPMLVAHGANFFLAAKTDKHNANYEGKSTVFFVRDVKGNQGTQPSALRVNYHSVASRILDADSSNRSGEIVMIDSDGHLRAYRIDPRSARLLWQTPPLFGEGIAVGDLNGDATVEIAATLATDPEGANGVLRDRFVILEERDGLYTIVWMGPSFEGKIVDLKIDDADNDDKHELVICLRNLSGSQIRLYAAAK